MKIGIIADIHAQLEPLKQALALFEREGVDRIVCAGDVVEKGYDGDAVVRVLQQCRIPCVRGNHDEMAVGNQRWWRKQMNPDDVQRILQALKQGANNTQSRLLTDEALLYLQTLPFSRSYVWEGYRVLLGHGSPRSNSTYLMPAMSDETLARHVGHIEADIFICGHTHRPMRRDVGHVSVLNPGCVCGGTRQHDSGTCAILTLPQFEFRVYSLASGQLLPSA